MDLELCFMVMGLELCFIVMDLELYFILMGLVMSTITGQGEGCIYHTQHANI